MKIDWRGIREGIINNIFRSEKIAEVKNHRLAICNTCPKHSKYHSTIRPDAHCTECGCNLDTKTACMSCQCPLSKWMALMTTEEEDKLSNS